VNLPPVADGEYLLCGHTHVPKFEKRGGYMYVNPGSVSIPKEDSPHSYMIFEDRFIWKTLDGEIYMEES
jgi:predicted phosphodiesterase